MKNVFEMFSEGGVIARIDISILSTGLRVHKIIKRILETDWEIGIKIRGQK